MAQQNPRNPKSGSCLKMLIAIGAGTALLISFVVFQDHSAYFPDNPEVEKVYDPDDYAITMSWEFVKKNLRSPSTAEFAPIREHYKEKQPDGSYKVSGYLDSQNAFGATIRSRYTCHLKPADGRNWQLLDLEIR